MASWYSPDEVVTPESFSGMSLWESALACALKHASDDIITCDALLQVE